MLPSDYIDTYGRLELERLKFSPNLKWHFEDTYLSVLPWILRLLRGLAPTISPLTRSTLALWDSLHNRYCWEYNSSIMPLLRHGYFMPGVLDLRSMCRVDQPTFMDQWQYVQLSQSIWSLPQPIRSLKEQNPIEAIVHHKDSSQHCISLFYKALLTLQNPDYPDYTGRWEADLQTRFTDKQKYKIIQLSYMSTTSRRMVEVHFKLLTRWHYTPV